MKDNGNNKWKLFFHTTLGDFSPVFQIFLLLRYSGKFCAYRMQSSPIYGWKLLMFPHLPAPSIMAWLPLCEDTEVFGCFWHKNEAQIIKGLLIDNILQTLFRAEGIWSAQVLDCFHQMFWTCEWDAVLVRVRGSHCWQAWMQACLGSQCELWSSAQPGCLQVAHQCALQACVRGLPFQLCAGGCWPFLLLAVWPATAT